MGVSSYSVFRSTLVLIFLTVIAAVAPGQRLVHGTKPRETSVPGRVEAFCSMLSGGFRVCKVREPEAVEAEYFILKGEAVVNRLPAPFWMGTATSPDGFFAYRGDLDRDGSSEIVVVSLEGVSNGMGITYSTVYIFDGRSVEARGDPISVAVAGYDSIEPKRGMGMYLMGKWFRYRNKRLEPVLEKPTLARRLLNSFAEERDNSWYENRYPHKWLTDRRAHKLLREPAERSKLASVRFATIRAFQQQPLYERPNAEIEFDTEAGASLKGKIRRGRNSDADDKAIMDIESIGIWKARYLYPIPFNGDLRLTTFLDRIEGRRVRLETYRPEHGNEYTKVWLLDE
jgi:hypothetical protein